MDDCGIMIGPEPGRWAEALAPSQDRGETARRFRTELGLDALRPVVMAGHQAQIWHPGILAKMLAQDAAARAFGASAAWVVVDQDEIDPWAVRYPVRLADGRLENRVWRVGGEPNAEAGHVPDVNRAAVRDVRAPALQSGEQFAAAGAGDGLARIARALASAADAPNAAEQVSRATRTLIDGLIDPPRFFGATRIAGTSLFAELLARARSDPARLISTYNAAVDAHADAHVAPLSAGELPIWHIPHAPNTPRRRVTADMLPGLPAHELAPRALLMTGILRWAGCDLFVHGTGGAGGAEEGGSGGYDAITTEWFRAWLGVELAPTAVVTATLRLRFEGAAPTLTPRDIERARWLAHAARHRPELLHDAEGERERGAAVATLRKLRWKRDPAARRAKLEAYRSLHRTLERVRDRHAGDLRNLDEAAATAAARRREAEIIADRTWAFPLYEAEQLQMLKSSIDERFGR